MSISDHRTYAICFGSWLWAAWYMTAVQRLAMLERAESEIPPKEPPKVQPFVFQLAGFQGYVRSSVYPHLLVITVLSFIYCARVWECIPN